MYKLFYYSLFCSAIVSATLKCLMKFYNITDDVKFFLTTIPNITFPLRASKVLNASFFLQIQTSHMRLCVNVIVTAGKRCN